MSLTPWKNSHCLAWDFTCPDTLAPNLAPSFCFVPVAVETLGAGAVELLHELGRRITESTGERHAMKYLLQWLSVAILRGNAASVLGTVGLESADSQKLYAVFYL